MLIQAIQWVNRIVHIVSQESRQSAVENDAGDDPALPSLRRTMCGVTDVEFTTYIYIYIYTKSFIMIVSYLQSWVEGVHTAAFDEDRRKASRILAGALSTPRSNSARRPLDETKLVTPTKVDDAITGGTNDNFDTGSPAAETLQMVVVYPRFQEVSV
ncbi:hypothetical protein CISG_03528 [Coccidioides immitis RMSCC 3703]|uniref:Uncharacterized protein n=1 Tax=Coccidioides immitis RMSCC 3703 TaxID=454286 RepID=A0A0J8QPW0_COCIT|nr:hypothetical protein CISG_03528 [Coccidioides immitis RMSCC 3703]